MELNKYIKLMQKIRLKIYSILFVFFVIFYGTSVLAVEHEVDEESEMETSGYLDSLSPDETGAPMPNIGISEEKHLVETVEGVGRIPYNRVAFREGPSLKSKIIRYSTGSEKVILIGEKDDWYKVIMYNNEEAYILKRFVRVKKIYRDESVTKNYMDKTVSIVLNDLLEKFDKTVEQSSYTKKNEIRPIFTLVDARSVKKHVTFTFNYSSAKIDGEPIPSYASNTLYKHMQTLVDLILGRAILSEDETYEIIIKIPTFDDTGKVLHYNKEYAKILLKKSNVTTELIRKNNGHILDYVECTMNVRDLFKNFPK